MADRVKGKVIQRSATSFKQKKLRNLADDEWAVYSTDPIILSQINGELSYPIEEMITYRRRQIPVRIVPFYVVEFLKNNRSNHPNYISFHRRKRSGVSSVSQEYGLWNAWQEEGKATPNAFLKKVFKNWGI
ncbi:hypothetical protein K9M47_01015 [Candidatus Gracilibacteria bacterium]|nr:hypothetical protein [Candidatus Gracilibacteria bacterium]